MAQFDVYLNTHPETRKTIPYLLDVQADLLEPLTTRLVIPLVLAPEVPRIMDKLNLKAKVVEIDVVLSVPELAGIPVRVLGERVSNLGHMRDDIIAAIDFLITGS